MVQKCRVAVLNATGTADRDSAIRTPPELETQAWCAVKLLWQGRLLRPRQPDAAGIEVPESIIGKRLAAGSQDYYEQGMYAIDAAMLAMTTGGAPGNNKLPSLPHTQKLYP